MIFGDNTRNYNQMTYAEFIRDFQRIYPMISHIFSYGKPRGTCRTRRLIKHYVRR